MLNPSVTDIPSNVRGGINVNQRVGHDEARLIKISGIGQDRPGIVNGIARTIASNGGNIILQRSMKVAGEFAITVVASFDKDNVNGAQHVMQGFGDGALGDNFIVFAREITIDSFASQTSGGTKYIVNIYGDDQMGIVESMTLLLLQNNLNLDFMESEVTYRPFQGTKTFSSLFEITVPEGFDMDTFSAELDQFETNYDLTVIIKQQ